MNKNEIKNYVSELDGNPSVYVGTYKKYNNGDLSGAWLDLTKFADVDEFLECCRALHQDEDDPEFMLQDYECFPSSLYSESMDVDDIQRIIDLWNDYDEDDRDDRDKIFEYWEGIDEDEDPDKILDKCVYRGDMEDFAYELAEESGDLDKIPSWLQGCIDWEHAARELSYDYHATSNYIFSAY